MSNLFNGITGFLTGSNSRVSGDTNEPSQVVKIRPALNNFRSNLLNKNISRTNRFGVTIAFETIYGNDLAKLVKEQTNIGSFVENITQAISSPRNAIDFFQNALTNSLSAPMSNNAATLLLHFSCYAASIPGQTLATSDFRTYGPNYKMPYQTNYQDLNLEFYCNGDMEQKKIFDYWMAQIHNPNSNNINYFDRYKCRIFINQYKESPKIRTFPGGELVNGLVNAGISIGSRFDSSGYVDYARQYLYEGSPDPYADSSYQIELIDAYPISVDPLSTSWEDSNDLHRLKVTFAYKYHNSLNNNRKQTTLNKR